MKKCPYCAEMIKDEAIVCKHCGRDLVPDVNQRVKSQIQSPKDSSYTKTSGVWKLPPDYEPPNKDIQLIYKTKISQLQRGDWILLTAPALSGYNPRHYKGNITEKEYLKLEEDLLKWAWENSDQTPEDLEEKIIESYAKFNVSFFSSVKSMYKKIAANDAKDWLLSRLRSGYSRDSIREIYKSSLEKLVRYALTEQGSIRDVSTLERLEKIEQNNIFSPKKDIPNEFIGFVLEEAKKQISALGEYPSQFISVSYPPGFFDQIDETAVKLANEIDQRHKKAPPKSPERMIVEFEEIEAMIRDVIEVDSRYDDVAQAMLRTRVKNQIREMGYF